MQSLNIRGAGKIVRDRGKAFPTATACHCQHSLFSGDGALLLALLLCLPAARFSSLADLVAAELFSEREKYSVDSA